MKKKRFTEEQIAFALRQHFSPSELRPGRRIESETASCLNTTSLRA